MAKSHQGIYISVEITGVILSYFLYVTNVK